MSHLKKPNDLLVLCVRFSTLSSDNVKSHCFLLLCVWYVCVCVCAHLDVHMYVFESVLNGRRNRDRKAEEEREICQELNLIRTMELWPALQDLWCWEEWHGAFTNLLAL